MPLSKTVGAGADRMFGEIFEADPADIIRRADRAEHGKPVEEHSVRVFGADDDPVGIVRIGDHLLKGTEYPGITGLDRRVHDGFIGEFDGSGVERFSVVKAHPPAQGKGPVGGRHLLPVGGQARLEIAVQVQVDQGIEYLCYDRIGIRVEGRGQGVYARYILAEIGDFQGFTGSHRGRAE